jgi:hypothetical protein
MERHIAEKLMQLFLKAGEPLNEATDIINHIESEEEQKSLRRPIGQIIGKTYTDLMIPIIKEYPDLDPDK